MRSARAAASQSSWNQRFGSTAATSSSEVLAPLPPPADLVDQINSLSTLAPGTPQVEVLVNEEDPVKAQLVDERISTLLAQANLAITRRIATEGGHYLNLLIDGGNFQVLGQTVHILGLRAFGTQLLCEQVVGRGLRRLSYEPGKDGVLFDVEYAAPGLPELSDQVAAEVRTHFGDTVCRNVVPRTARRSTRRILPNLKIANQGSVSVVAAPGPVIDADDPQWR